MPTLHIAEAVRGLSPGSVIRADGSARVAAALARLIGSAAAGRVLDAVGAERLGRMHADELAAVAAIRPALAARIVAARDLGLALHAAPIASFTSAADVARHLPAGIERYETEILLGFALTSQLMVHAVVLLAKGGSTGTSVQLRDILTPFVRLGAHAFVLAHNHPGGNPTPSSDDVTLTNRVAAAARTIGIELVDHIVIAAGGTVSFRDTGLLPTEDELASCHTAFSPEPPPATRT